MSVDTVDAIWTELQDTLSMPVVLYLPTTIPSQFSQPKLEGVTLDATGKPEYTVVYTAPDAILAFILGNGMGALGNLPAFPPTSTEALTIYDHPATLNVIPSESPPSQFIDVTWQDQGSIYSIRCFGNACAVDDIRQIAANLIRLDSE